MSGPIADGSQPPKGNRHPIRTVTMRKLTLLLFVPLVLSDSSFGQQRVEIGVFLDYLSISQTGSNDFGLGARFGYRVHHNVMLEGELAYDYGVNFKEVYRDVSNGNIAAIEHTSIGVTQGLIGPKIQPSGGGFRPFVTLKGGFLESRLSPSLLPQSTIVSSVLGLRTSSWNAAIYPAAGIEAAIGPLGLRLEAGDEVYFNNGAHNNLRITFGPILRF
jgi:hypothetical protein